MLAVDGKTLCGARRAQGAQTMLTSVSEHGHRLILTQAEVVDSDEIAAFSTVPATLGDLRGALSIADAPHCQREQATWLSARGRALPVHRQGLPADPAAGTA